MFLIFCFVFFFAVDIALFLSFLICARPARRSLPFVRGDGPRVLRGAGLCLPSRFTGPRRNQRRWRVPLSTAPVALIVLRQDTTERSRHDHRNTSTFSERAKQQHRFAKKKGWSSKSKKNKTETQSSKKKRRSKAASSHYLTKCNTAVLTLFPGGSIPLFRASGYSRLDLGRRYSAPAVTRSG